MIYKHLCIVDRHDVLWNGPVRASVCPSVCPSVLPSTIACERDILRTAYLIDFVF